MSFALASNSVWGSCLTCESKEHSAHGTICNNGMILRHKFIPTTLRRHGTSLENSNIIKNFKKEETDEKQICMYGRMNDNVFCSSSQ